MRIVELTKVQFDNYSTTNEFKNFYQTSQYGTLMSRHGFKDIYIALVNDNNKILAASLILIQNLFANFKCAYAPRGFLIDYNNFDLVTAYTNLIKKYLSNNGISYLKMDPYIVHINRNVKSIPINNKKNGIEIINHLKSIGYVHTGFNLYFENLKPRWNAVLKTEENQKNIFTSFSKKTRNKIRSANKKGIKIYKGSKNDINLFFDLIDKKHTRKINYYLDYYEIFAKYDMFDIYFAKIDPSIYLKNSKLLYENELSSNYELSESMQKNIGNISTLNKKMESDKLLDIYKKDVVLATKLNQTYHDGIVIAANAIIKYDNEVFFLIDGIDCKYKKFNANYLLKWKIIEKYSKEGYTKFHFNGITGDFNPESKYYGLYDFKTGFNANVKEYIGEFNIITNKPYYKTYKNLKIIEKLFGRNLKKH